MADDVTQTTGQDPVQDDSQVQGNVQSQGDDTVQQDDSKNVNSSGGGDQQNPLDVLEKLLNEIDQGKTAGSKPKSGGPQDVPAEPTGPTPEEIAAKEQEQRRIEFEQKQAEQKIIDQQKIEEQRKALENEMANGSANIARATQDEEQKMQKTEKIQADEGFEIVQLDHTKI